MKIRLVVTAFVTAALLAGCSSSVDAAPTDHDQAKSKSSSSSPTGPSTSTDSGKKTADPADKGDDSKKDPATGKTVQSKEPHVDGGRKLADIKEAQDNADGALVKFLKSLQSRNAKAACEVIDPNLASQMQSQGNGCEKEVLSLTVPIKDAATIDSARIIETKNTQRGVDLKLQTNDNTYLFAALHDGNKWYIDPYSFRVA